MTSNADTVRGIYESFNKGDIEAVLASLHPDIEWWLPESLPFGGSYRGTKEVGRFFASLPEYFPELKVEPKELIASGSQVVAVGRHRGRGAKAAFDIPFAMVWDLRDGKPVRFREYQDTAATLRAIGA